MFVNVEEIMGEVQEGLQLGLLICIAAFILTLST
jgi:hypothetical protein